MAREQEREGEIGTQVNSSVVSNVVVAVAAAASIALAIAIALAALNVYLDRRPPIGGTDIYAWDDTEQQVVREENER